MLHSLGSAVQIDDTLVDFHLEPVPSLGALTTRGLPGGDLENLSGHTYRALHFEFRVLGPTNEVATHCVTNETLLECTIQ